MKLLAALVLVLALSACAPVPVDPYTARYAADGAIQATQIAVQLDADRKAQSATLQAMASNDEAARQALIIQQAAQGTQSAMSAQMTQFAFDGLQATATTRAQQATATQGARHTEIASTSTAYPPMATATAWSAKQDANERTVKQVAGLVFTVFFVAVGAFAIRLTAPILLATVQNIAMQIRARAMVREMGGQVFALVAFGANEQGLYLPAAQVLDYARMIVGNDRPRQIEAPYQGPEESEAQELQETPAQYWHIRQILQATIEVAPKRKYKPNQLASHPICRLGAPTWTEAIKVLKLAGVEIDVRDNVGTFITDARYPTVQALLDDLLNHDSPTPLVNELFLAIERL